MRVLLRFTYRLLFGTLMLAALLIRATLASGQPARASGPTEDQVKAAFLLNFTKFVDWPPAMLADANTPFSICILGDDSFGSMLDQMVEGETVDGHRIQIKRIHGRSVPGCAVLFVSDSEKDTRDVVAAAGSGVLTVGDGDGFLADGGIIAFVLDRRRVRFDINQRAASAAGLKLSSKLLSVARSVSN